MDKTSKMLMATENTVGWIKYDGEVFFAAPNYKESKKSGKPMIDLCYCATYCMNGRVQKTVEYEKERFTEEIRSKP